MSDSVIELRVRLFDYWHAGSGRGRGPLVDAEVVRTPAGLPRLPGRTLRGLCREGMQQAVDAGLVESETLYALFGSRTGGEGALAFDDATLGADFERWVGTLEGRSVVESLYTELASTRIDADSGQASDDTLRTIEVAVPMSLAARVFVRGHTSPDTARVAFDESLGFIRGLGAGRRRGLGRVRISRKGGRGDE